MRSLRPVLRAELYRRRQGTQKASNEPKSGSEQIDERIAALDDWRGEMLARIRALIKKADPDVVEDVKWRQPSNPAGDAVWSHAGLIRTGEAYRDKVKLTFARGASLADPGGLFNAGLGGNTRRAMDLRKGDEVDPEAFEALIRAAVTFNEESSQG